MLFRVLAEQFIILCPQTELNAAKNLADRLDCISSHHSLVENFKTAMGLSELRESEEFTEWFERTMKALYQSKRVYAT